MIGRNTKMQYMLYGIWMVWLKGVSNTIFLDSLKHVRNPKRLKNGPSGNLNRFVPPSQQVELLEILRDKYKCLNFTVEPLFETPEALVRAAFWEKEINEYTKDEFLKKIAELSAQKRYKITINDNFFGVLNDFFDPKDNATIIHLNLKDITKTTAVLYANDVEVHNFQSKESFPYKLIAFALKAENGALISQSDVLGDSKRNRGCSQDLSDIFEGSVIKDVFARNITKYSFEIYHTITEDDLKNVSSFQKIKPDGVRNTKYFLDYIKKSRLTPDEQLG